MDFQHLTILLPCHSLEDFAAGRPEDESEQLLSGWSALWHPALVAAVGKMPHWAPAAAPPSEPAGHLCVLPPCCEGLLRADWLEEAQAAGAHILRGFCGRRQLVAAALEALGPGAAAVEPPLAADFLALGYCCLAVELLTRKLRYMSRLDEPALESHLVAAAKQAVGGRPEAARGHLQSAFDLLHSAREYFFPVEPHLLDLTLVASTTLGPALRGELAAGTPVNLLLSGEVLDEMARREPASLRALRDALSGGRVALLGGHYRERELTLQPPEAILDDLRAGLAASQRHLGCRPLVFGRRRFGLAPVLPQILEKCGFLGALHATLDDGRFPTGDAARIRWEGADGTTLEALQRIPDDAARSQTFLALPERLGSAAGLEQSPTIVLAHWPGQTAPWYHDLRRAAAYGSVLGSFATVTDYFQQTTGAGHDAGYLADQYHSPYLAQAVAAAESDPLSRWVRYFQRLAVVEATPTLDVLAALAGGGQFPPSPTGRGTASGVRGEGVAGPLVDANDPASDERLRADLDAAMRQLAAAVAAAQPTEARGILLANPSSFSRRLCLDLPAAAALPAVAEPVQAAGESAGRKTVVVDVPPLGFAWLAPQDPETAPPPKARWSLWGRRPKSQATLVQQEPGATPGSRQTVLRNEFFSVVIDPQSGAISRISDDYTRGPRLAQQLAMRLVPHAAGTADEAAYSLMAADEVRIVSAGPVLGEVLVRGRLMARDGPRLARFQQTTRVWRGSRVIELLIEMEPERMPAADPWDSYYAARFAWLDPAAKLFRGANLATVPTEVEQLESPHFLDLRTEKTRTTLLAAGLPYHRRCGQRKLDTLLLVRGETARRFRLGIALDPPSALAAALDFLAPLAMLADSARPGRPLGWLFHLDVRNVVATHWEVLCDGSAGFRVRLLETDGRAVQLNLRSFRALESAQKLSNSGGPAEPLPVEGDCIAVNLRPYEWAEVEACFKADGGRGKGEG
jgi:alpha-mannosidase